MSASLQSLMVYRDGQRLTRIEDPGFQIVLDWLRHLGNDGVSNMLILTPDGWLDIGRLGESISISFCSHDLQACRSEIVSAKAAAEHLRHYMGHETARMS